MATGHATLSLSRISQVSTEQVSQLGTWRRRFFPPHFSANNMHKDLTGAIRLAEQHGVALPAVSISREILRGVIAKGHGEHDSSEIVAILEDMAGTSVSRFKE